jgi:deoxyribonuclease I
MTRITNNWAILFLIVLFALYILNDKLYAASEARQLKVHLNQIYHNHRFTFFCDDVFSPKGEIDFQPCDNCPLIHKKIQWMPIVPLWELAKQLNCYQEKMCINKKGQAFKGLRCCQQLDRSYQKMSVDLHNFVPEVPLLKQQRRRFAFGFVQHHASSNACHLYIDQKQKIVEPSPHLRGMIARIYLYMRDTYHFPLSPAQTNLFLAWHKEYPVSEWERERNEKIRALQGNGNPYII